MGVSLAKIQLGFEAGDTNFYRYVFNNPGSFIDPFGLETKIYIHQGSFPGHVAIDVDGTVYTFGRYGEISGSSAKVGSGGDGILYRVPRDEYLRHGGSFVGENAFVEAWKLPLTEQEERGIVDIFEEYLTNENLPDRQAQSGARGKRIKDYNLLWDSCVSITRRSLPNGLIKDALNGQILGMPVFSPWGTSSALGNVPGVQIEGVYAPPRTSLQPGRRPGPPYLRRREYKSRGIKLLGSGGGIENE
jgi:hypothetical protein